MKRTKMATIVILILVSSACEMEAKSGLSAHEHGGHGEESHGEHEGHDTHGGREHDHGEHGIGGHGDEAREAHDNEGTGRSEEETVSLSPKAIERGGIVLGQARAGALAGAVEVPAEVQLNPERVAHISPLLKGQLLSVDATLGDRVERDQSLVKLRSVELGQARAALSLASSRRSVAKENLARQKRLREEGINSQRSLLEAEFAYEQADAALRAARSHLKVFGVKGGAGPDMTIESPIAGVVVERHATRGENVAPNDTLFIVADMTRVWVIGRVYEQQVSLIKAGMSATLSLNAYPGRTWTGAVSFVGASLDESTRTLPVRVEFENLDGFLRPGLFGELRLERGERDEEVVMVPAAAIQTMNGRSIVFVPTEEEGVFGAHQVTLGRQGSRDVEVIEGLEPGAKLVVEGAFILKSELMRSELGHGHAH